jgi:hypothetical protein
MIFTPLLVATAASPLLLGVNAMTNMAAAVAPYYKVPGPDQYHAGGTPVINGQDYGLPNGWRQLAAPALMDALQKVYNVNTVNLLNTTGKHSIGCTPDNIIVRKEWYAVT